MSTRMDSGEGNPERFHFKGVNTRGDRPGDRRTEYTRRPTGDRIGDRSGDRRRDDRL